MLSSILNSTLGNSLLLAQAEEPLKQSFWFPEQNSTFAESSDALYMFILYLSIFFFVLIVGVMVYFLWKYRERPGFEPQPSPAHNTPLEVTWSVIPALLMLVMFVWGFMGFVDVKTPPEDCYEINVTAKQWGWAFKYPNGHTNTNLHVPLDKPTRLVMTSLDVIHSLSVPAFRTKQDVMPGRYTKMWFQPIQAGEFPLYCTEYCGQQHSQMLARVFIHGPNTEKLKQAEVDKMEEKEMPFDEWLVYASDITKNEKFWDEDKNFVPKLAGKYLYETRGCAQCHSIDGTKKVGPSFKESFGTQVQIEGSSDSVAMDENYIRESILNPMAKVHKGYPPKMPSYSGQLNEDELNSLVAFIKSLKK